MSTETSQRFPTLGVILIAVGIILLINRMSILVISIGNLLTAGIILYGLLLVVRSLKSSNRSSVFWGTALFLFGIFLFLKSIYVLTGPEPVLVPAFFLIFGFAFLMTFIVRPSDWHMLIPSLFFLGIGFILLGERLTWLDPTFFEKHLVKYWPALLIVFGLGLLVKAKRRVRGIAAKEG